MSNLKRYERELVREREKLDRMIGASMGTPMACNKAILKQSRKVDRLVARLQNERERQKEKEKSIIFITTGGMKWM